MLGLLELELQMLMGHTTWVLRTDLQSLARTARVLHRGTAFSAPIGDLSENDKEFLFHM